MTNYGLNISGYINKQFGLGEGVRCNIRAATAANIPFKINDFDLEISAHILPGSHFPVDQQNPYDVNLIQINFDRVEQLFSQTDKSYFSGKYNIAFWAWELEEFPEEYRKCFRFFDEVWVPSNFSADAVSRFSPVPVIKMMHSIDIKQTECSRETFGIPNDRYMFLAMFDYYSSIARKNPIGVIEAYEQAFGTNNPDTILVLKSSVSTEFPDDRQKISDRIAANSSIYLIEEILPQDKLYSLMNCCDCYVSLHRSEGFGLTIAEAMYLGKPVIATAYSANIEFMNINNSLPVKFSMKPVGNDYAFVGGEGFWADPDTGHAAQLMKYAFENPEEITRIARQGQTDIKDNLNPTVIGLQIKERLDFIYSDLLPAKGQRSSAKEAMLKMENEVLQQKIKTLRGYLPIKMKIAFKNFKNKLTGNTRKYSWEE